MLIRSVGWFCKRDTVSIPWKVFAANPQEFCHRDSLPNNMAWADPSHITKVGMTEALEFWKKRQDDIGQGIQFIAWYNKTAMCPRPDLPTKDLPKRHSRSTTNLPVPDPPQTTAKRNPPRPVVSIPKRLPEAVNLRDDIPSISRYRPRSVSVTSSTVSFDADDFAGIDLDINFDTQAESEPHSPVEDDIPQQEPDLLDVLASLRIGKSTTATATPLTNHTVKDGNVTPANGNQELQKYLASIIDDTRFRTLVEAWGSSLVGNVRRHRTIPITR